MRQEPDPALIPIDFEDFPYYVQELFGVFNLLPDMWDGMSGSYLGKDLTLVPYIFNLNGIEDQKFSLYILNLIIAENVKIYNDKLKQKTEAAKRKK